MRRAALLVLVLGFVAALVVGLNQAADSQPERAPAAAFDLEEALARLEGAPPPLAALHDQANELLEADADAFRDRLDELRGFPVVVNVWGSWCAPCRREFPLFQEVSTQLGDRVAFIGIDVVDPPDGAREFLDETPVPYPSFRDETGDELTDVVDAPLGAPHTIFIDREGEVVIPRSGEYLNADQLREDIRRYLRV